MKFELVLFNPDRMLGWYISYKAQTSILKGNFRCTGLLLLAVASNRNKANHSLFFVHSRPPAFQNYQNAA